MLSNSLSYTSSEISSGTQSDMSANKQSDMPSKPTIILAIESSCDETAAAVVANGRDVLSSAIATQLDVHQKYGGVVPELAAREHMANIVRVLAESLEQAGVTRDDISAIAVANCPGLAPALLIGVTAAKTLAWAWGKPLIAVNHVHCHLQAVMLGQDADCFPAVALVVSGGHTNLYYCQGPLNMELLGKTRDDAAGEAFDKVAMLLGLGYPGGPLIDKLARQGNPKAIRFPRTMLEKDSLDFSFSGLKTAVLYHCQGQDMLGENRLADMTEQEKANIAASFQAAVVDVLIKKTTRAIQQTKAHTVLLGGGVAANNALRQQLSKQCEKLGCKLLISTKKYCTDNAAMVGGLAYYKLQAGMLAPLTLEPHARA